MVTELSVDQNSDDWHRLRDSKIGSSDISAILGLSPFTNVYELWQRKTRMINPHLNLEFNEAVSRGSLLEPVVREMYEHEFNNEFLPTVFVDGDFIASVDGANEQLRRLIEIKVPGAKVIEKALNGEVIEYYRAQIQWQLMVSEYDHCDYVVFDHNENKIAKIIRVTRDQKMMDEMKVAAIRFMDCVREFKEPDGFDPFKRIKSWEL